MSKLISTLRTETAVIHKQLHLNPMLQPLHSSNLTPELYKLVLCAFYGFYSPLERLLNNSPKNLLDQYKNQDFLENLKNDLKYHNIHYEDLALCEFNLTEIDVTKTIGYLYLREGSALGGQVISKHIERQLSFNSGIENKFFYGAGKNSLKKWHDYLEDIQKLEAKNSVDIQGSAYFARTLFEKLNDWLNDYV